MAVLKIIILVAQEESAFEGIASSYDIAVVAIGRNVEATRWTSIRWNQR
jgi:hypothetical protein